MAASRYRLRLAWVGIVYIAVVVSTVFALITAAVTTFFSAAWFFTPLDLDPHSATTKLVFIFAPVFSLGFAMIASGVAWIVARST